MYFKKDVLRQITVVLGYFYHSREDEMLVTNCHPTRLRTPKDSNIYVHVREKRQYYRWKQLLNQ